GASLYRRRARWPTAAAAARPPRRTGPAAPAASTRSRPGSPAPSRDAARPPRSAGRAVFFSRVPRVGADQPVLGPLPADAQALEHPADGFAAEQAWGPALLDSDLGGQGQRPQAGRLAEVARGLVQQGAQVVVAAPGPGGVNGLGGLGLGAQAAQALGGEGPQGIADGLHAAAECGSDLGGALAPVAVQQDLGATQGEGVGGAEALPEGGTLRRG